MMVSAKGCYYTDADGRKIFDGLSGLWCCGLGHGRAEIAEAVAPADSPRSTTRRRSSSATRCRSRWPTSSRSSRPPGSTTCSSPARARSRPTPRSRWRAPTGAPRARAARRRLIGREKGYHGVNFGGISVGGIGANRKMFGQGIEADHLPHTQLAGNAFIARHGRHRAPSWPTTCSS